MRTWNPDHLYWTYQYIKPSTVMNCPDEISKPILQIMSIGLLNIRAFGSAGNASRCSVEADHLHNLPRLLASYSPELLKFYLDVEQPIFVKDTAGEGLVLFE